MSGLLCVLMFVVLAGLVLCATEWFDATLEERSLAYRRFWAAAWGEDEPMISHVSVITNHACRFCGSVGYHDQGCSNLDRRDAGEATR